MPYIQGFTIKTFHFLLLHVYNMHTGDQRTSLWGWFAFRKHLLMGIVECLTTQRCLTMYGSAAFASASEYLCNYAKMCCCCICLIMQNCFALPA